MMTLNEYISKLGDLEPTFMHEFVTEVKQKTPVRTGRLRDGWMIDGDSIKNDVPYVKYVEYGTTKAPPRGMLSTTIVESPQILQASFIKAVGA